MAERYPRKTVPDRTYQRPDVLHLWLQMDPVWLACPCLNLQCHRHATFPSLSTFSAPLCTRGKPSNLLTKLCTSEAEYEKLVSVACLYGGKWNVQWVWLVFLLLFLGDLSLSLLLMEEITAERLQMAMAVYLLCDLASTHTSVLPLEPS